jgi:hypothetical protein
VVCVVGYDNKRCFLCGPRQGVINGTSLKVSDVREPVKRRRGRYS